MGLRDHVHHNPPFSTSAVTASRTGTGVLRAIESRIRGYYIIIVIGANYYADRRREEHIFYTTSGKYKDWGNNSYYTAKFTIRGLKR